MATPRVLRFDADGRPLEFSVWLLHAHRLLESQVQSGESLWAHATGNLPAPNDPTPLGSAPDDAARARFASQCADLTAWKSRDAAACIALSSLLPKSEDAHFTQVRTTSELLTAIKARYATPTTVSLGRLFLSFLFPDLASFERSADLIAHLRSLDSSYRAACTDAQLALLPPPMAITIYFIATSLPDHLASVRDALLLKHPSELTIEVLESALKDVESNLRSVASASGAVPPPLFHGCTVPQLPTFTASLATATTDVTAAAVTTSSRSRGRGGKRGGQGTGGGGGGGVAGGGGGGGMPTGGGGSAGPGEASRAAAGDPATAAGGGDARACQPPSGLPAAAGGAAAWYLAQRKQQQQQQRQQQVSGPAQRQPQRGAVHPSCTYQLLTGAREASLVVAPTLLVSAFLSSLTRFAWPTVLEALPLTGTPHAMYVVVDSSASDSVYSSVACLGACLAELPLASVGTCVFTSLGARSEDASLSFTLDSGALHCFFRDHTTLTPLPAPVSVALADPTSGPVTARYTTTLPCPAVPSRSLTGFHVPSFLRNLVGVRPLVSQHMGVWIEPFGETATLTCLLPPLRRSRAQVAVFGQVPVSGPVSASCSCRSLAHPTVLWHHRTGHPSLPRLRAMSRQRLVLGLPRVLPSLPPLLAPPCDPCVEAEPVVAGDSCLPGVGAGPADFGGATSGGAGAPSLGPGEPGRASVGGADTGGGAPERGERVAVAGGAAATAGAAAAAAAGAAAAGGGAGAGAATAVGGGAAVAAAAPAATAAAAAAAAATSSSCLRPPRPSPSVLPSPPESALITSLSTPVTDYYRTYRPVLSHVLASLVTHPRASVSSVSALTAAVTEFASTRRLDFATSLVAAPPSSPLAVGGVSALGCDALEDRRFELEFLAANSLHLCAMVLAPAGDLDALDILTPRTYAEVVSGPWASQWSAAMDAEMASYRSTGTYVDEVPPPGANVVDGMWIYRVKRPPGSPPVFKARYVARGFRQREGVDFFQTFAPTPKMTTLRVLLHIAAQRDYELHSLDFSTAFLQGSLHKEVWLRRPSAFTGTFRPGTQWRLRRPVYGLRQAPHEWHDTLRSTLADLGFQPSSADPSLFVHRGSTPFFVLVYVDDLVFATADRVALADVKSELQKRHTCTDLGELRHYLGLHITRDRAARTITLSQSHMVQQVLQRFELQHSTVQRTLLAVDHRLTGPFPDEPFESSGPYAELVGCLITPRRESLQPNPTYAAIAQSEPSGKDTWFLDSCCGQHMSSSVRFVQHEHQLQREVVITVANYQNLRTRRQGVVQLQSRETNVILQMSKVLIAEGLGYNLLSVSQLMAKGIHLEADSTTQEFKLYNGKGGLYIGKAVLKNNVFVLDFVPDLGTADSDGIATFTSWTHPPDLDLDFSPEGFWYSHTIPEK
ncbi:unnamed protein product [Closterium sp. NIES-54]